ncbi:Y-family DNA polymerase [Listeria aquatica]|uniref:Y-family DNA polymerase n=1 Tax=Listeria aquatica TaxID=1494960 RepID=UPI003EF9C8FC
MDYSHAPKRDILCIDVKSFFASVECVARGLNPLETHLVVMSNADRAGGLVLAASPKMKNDFGIKTGARRFELPDDPRILIAPPRMNYYLKMNAAIQEIFLRFVPEEYYMAYSIDESFLDVTGSHALFGTTIEIARKIQETLYKELGLFVTVGVGDNMLLAKLAMDNEAKKKVSGLAEWRYSDVPRKLWNISKITDFWGIGDRMAKRLQRLGIFSVYDLSQAPDYLLKKELGVIGLELKQHAHGLDYSRINEQYVPAEKSYGKSQILERDYQSAAEVIIVIQEMTEEIAMRLRTAGVDTSTITLFVGYSKYSILRGFRHQMKIQPTNASYIIKQTLLQIFWKYYENEPVRSIAVTCGTITHKKGLQLNLFEDPEKTLQKQQLDVTIDKIRKRYGFKSLMHANSLIEGATGVKRSSFVGGHQG